MAKSNDTDPQLPVVKSDEKETDPVGSFAGKVEDLMNHAVKESTSAPSATRHHEMFAKWANRLGDLWREVKQHV